MGGAHIARREARDSTGCRGRGVRVSAAAGMTAVGTKTAADLKTVTGTMTAADLIIEAGTTTAAGTKTAEATDAVDMTIVEKVMTRVDAVDMTIVDRAAQMTRVDAVDTTDEDTWILATSVGTTIAEAAIGAAAVEMKLGTTRDRRRCSSSYDENRTSAVHPPTRAATGHWNLRTALAGGLALARQSCRASSRGRMPRTGPTSTLRTAGSARAATTGIGASARPATFATRPVPASRLSRGRTVARPA